MPSRRWSTRSCALGAHAGSEPGADAASCLEESKTARERNAPAPAARAAVYRALRRRNQPMMRPQAKPRLTASARSARSAARRTATRTDTRSSPSTCRTWKETCGSCPATSAFCPQCNDECAHVIFKVAKKLDIETVALRRARGQAGSRHLSALPRTHRDGAEGRRGARPPVQRSRRHFFSLAPAALARLARSIACISRVNSRAVSDCSATQVQLDGAIELQLYRATPSGWRLRNAIKS